MYKNSDTKPLKERMEQRVKIARGHFLALLLITIVNIAILCSSLLWNADLAILPFFAWIPYFFVLIGFASLSITGMLICGGISLVCLILYFFCWLRSKKNDGWMVTALVLLAMDIVLMALFCLMTKDRSFAIYPLLNLLIVGQLISGIINGKKLRTLPDETAEEAEEPTENNEIT